MMTTSGGCGDGCELPCDRIKESGDFRRCYDVPLYPLCDRFLERGPTLIRTPVA